MASKRVTCQDDEASTGCLPKKTFIALLRIPEVSSNLAAYSRTARIIQDAKNRDDIVNWRAMNQEDGEDGEICLPAAIYLELFRNPAMRGHLSAVARAQKILESPAASYPDSDIKRSLAILAKNNDMPVTGQGHDGEVEVQNDGEGGGGGMDGEGSEFDHQTLDILLKILHENDQRNVHAIAREYTLPNGQIDFEAIARDYGNEKRNIASMARDFNLPPHGKRNVASLARDYALPGGKRNFSDFLTDALLSYEKKNIASLMRNNGGKRNVAALARDFALPPMPAGKGRKRAFFGSWGLPDDETENEEKRNIAALSKNDDWPIFNKRFGVGSSRILRFPTTNRFGRSLGDQDMSQELLNLQRLAHLNAERNHENAMMDLLGLLGTKNGANEKMLSGERRPKRQLYFSEEYPLPVMQNNNVFDYEDLIEALTGQYPKTEKRFMVLNQHLLQPNLELTPFSSTFGTSIFFKRTSNQRLPRAHSERTPYSTQASK
ncbi:neuropeptide-like 1 [Belonocnema kinseyi]|uniref:neuropeptide-like 1 n=1 Tax=Belonocnema kinseyi TaxID=2817044 RepID=UPI00143E077E|nr:neuropeptide-like 1 [Belonocnema kinseyi]